MRSAAVVLIAALSVPLLAQEPGAERRYPLPTEYTGWGNQRELTERGSHGEARWAALLYRHHSHPCEGMIDIYIKENRAKYPGNTQDGPFRLQCAPYALVVRNESQGPIQCHVVVQLEKPDVAGFQTLEMDRVLGPQSTRTLLRTFIAGTKPPKSHSVDCVTLPASALQDLDLPAECEPKIEGPPTDSLYPAYAKIQGLKGAVTLEFTLTSSGRANDVRVVETVEVEILADAALYYSKFLRATSPCVGKRARLRVRFADPQAS